MSIALSSPSLVVLIGPPASGKSTWAAENFRPEQILCADTLRAIVGEHELDLAASNDAFAVLDQILAMRMGRGLTTVIDTTGLDDVRRSGYLELARSSHAEAVVVRFATSATECKRRNRERRHPVPRKRWRRSCAGSRKSPVHSTTKAGTRSSNRNRSGR